MGSGVLRARMTGGSSYAAKVHATPDRVRRDWRNELREVQRLELTVEDFSDRYLAHMTAGESRSLKSWRTFHRAFREDFGGMSLRALTVSVWEAWLRARRTPDDPLCPFLPERGAVEVRTWNQRTALRHWKDFLITRLRKAKANPIAVRALTHPLTVESHADSHSLYAHDLDWASLCEAMDCLDLNQADDDDTEGEQIALPWGE